MLTTCLAKFDVRHALECKVGALIIMRHINEINEELCDLASKALLGAPLEAHVEPMIQSRRSFPRLKPQSPSPQSNAYPAQAMKSGEIFSSVASGPVIVDDVGMIDTDAKSHCLAGHARDPHKVFTTQEREKKKKYLRSCLEQHKHFAHFSIPTNGLTGREAGELLKGLSLQLADKWE
jgi:hypothetical protein